MELQIGLTTRFIPNIEKNHFLTSTEYLIKLKSFIVFFRAKPTLNF